MPSPRPSLTLLAGVMLLILAIIALVFSYGESTDVSNLIGEVPQSKRTRSMIETPSHPKKSTRSKRVSRIDRLISERFPEERDIEFNNGLGDLEEFYKARGLLDFCGHMRNALRGDEDSLAEIFTTYMAEPEAYGDFINILIENLGDDMFFQQVQRQPESIQYLILGQIWRRISRSPLNYQSDGSIPIADSGLYYPRCGELILVLLEKELQSDYWQQMKIKKSESGPRE